MAYSVVNLHCKISPTIVEHTNNFLLKLYQIMENTNQTTDTMPDIESIKKEAYERGRADAMAEIEAANPVVLSGYRKGFWE